MSERSQRTQTVMIVGSGGREHALGWRLEQSPRVKRVLVAPGNAGMPAHWERVETVGVGQVSEVQALIAQAIANSVDLVVIGPDQPLADGWVDQFQAAGIRCFGPTQAAAKLEWSKAFAKEMMQKTGVPTAAFTRFQTRGPGATSIERIVEWVKEQGWPRGAVVKVDGLALGKGVRVCGNLTETREAIQDLAGLSDELVIEERLQGEELSWMAFCDGKHCALLEPARDFKRMGEGDTGLNTGGMGAFSPVPGFEAEAHRERVRREVFKPILKGMVDAGIPFRGVLFAGLMVDGEKWSVLEFNARFGDPETQVLMTRWSEDLYSWCEAVAAGRLGEFTQDRLKNNLTQDPAFERTRAVVVVGAAEGYPSAPKKGAAIHVGFHHGLKAGSLFWAGVRARPSGQREVNGGRVVGAVGTGATLKAAREEAYEALKTVHFEGKWSRSDIAQRAAIQEGGPSVGSQSGRPQMQRILLLGSGRGSNAEAIFAAVKAGRLRAEILAVGSDRLSPGILERGKKHGIPTFSLRHQGEETVSPATLNQRLVEWIERHRPDFIVLAGYLRVLSPSVLDRMRDPERGGVSRTVNIHPSILPAFPGIHSYRQAFDYGVKVTGVTVHLVEETIDSGPICAQVCFSVEGLKTPEEWEAVGLQIEHELYPRTLDWVVNREFSVEVREGGRLHVRKN